MVKFLALKPLQEDVSLSLLKVLGEERVSNGRKWNDRPSSGFCILEELVGTGPVSPCRGGNSQTHGQAEDMPYSTLEGALTTILALPSQVCDAYFCA